MESSSANPSFSYNRVTWMAGVTTLFANFPLLIYGLYVNIFLREDLLEVIIIVTIIASLKNLLQIFLRIPLGELSQIIGRKPLIITGHFSYTFALLLMSIASDWTLVFVGTLFIGIGMSAFWPALFAYLADINLDRVGESQGRIFQMSDIGSIIGSLFAFFLLNELQVSLQTLFGTIALISLITGIISLLLLPESLAKSNRKSVDNVKRALAESWLSMLKSLKKISVTNRLWHVYTFHFILAFIEFTASMFVPLIIISKGFTNAEVSAISLWTLLLIFWAKPYLGKVTDRIDFLTAITISIIITCLTIIGYVFVEEFIFLIALQIVTNASIMVGYFTANGETTRRAPIEYR
ncbi:MAG: MFS transporter, partial [Candidatus Heimdallarchaeota archaeon]|nr:MFS transporter [Candidatus Heimdallarchaeota archaeon]